MARLIVFYLTKVFLTRFWDELSSLGKQVWHEVREVRMMGLPAEVQQREAEMMKAAL